MKIRRNSLIISYVKTFIYKYQLMEKKIEILYFYRITS